MTDRNPETKHATPDDAAPAEGGKPAEQHSGTASGAGSGAGGGGAPEDYDDDPKGGGGSLTQAPATKHPEGGADAPSHGGS